MTANPELTDREVQILRGMADGLGNAAIGAGLHISEDTVKTHARRLFRKLGARDRAHAVRLGRRPAGPAADEEADPGRPGRGAGHAR